MGSSDSKLAGGVALTGGTAERAATFTAPPAVTENAAGLTNFGNTCYCNAVLQAMYHTPPLRDRIRALHKVLKGTVSIQERHRLDDEEAERDRVKRHADGGERSSSDDDDEEDEAAKEGDGGVAGSPTSTTAGFAEASVGGPLATTAAAAPPPFDLKAHQDTVLSKLCDLFAQLEASAQSTKSRTIGPRNFVAKFKAENELFRNTLQQDAHEFAMFVLNTVIDDEKSLLQWKYQPSHRTKRRAPLERLLGGRTLSRTFCAECDTETSIAQPFLDVNIDVLPHASLRYCTEAYSAYETLTGEDRFRCDACTSPVDARRRVVFRALPMVLVVQLKRFSYQERVGGFTKRNDRVPFTSVMTVQTVCGAAVRFALCGVVVHQGATPNLGHYVAICTNAATRQWYRCDDETVTPFSERDLQRYFGVSDAMHDSTGTSAATAYLLFYRRL